MTELVILVVVTVLVGGAGVLLGLRLAPDIERWTEASEESDDDGRS